MRKISIVLMAVFCTIAARSAELQVRFSQDTVKVSGGETAVLPITINVPDNFDASLFLSVQAPTLSVEKPVVVPDVINPPYKNGQVRLTTIAGYSTGRHQIIIEAKNSAMTARDTCYIEILESTRWRVFPGINPRWIIQDRSGYYWFCRYSLGVGGHGVYRISPNLKDTALFSYAIPGVPSIAYGVAFDKKNYAWFAGGGYDGLYRYNGEFWSKYNKDNSSLPDNSVEVIAVDSSDNVWAGTRKGLARLSGSEWTVFTSDNSVVSNEPVHDVAVDAGGNIWVALGSGLAKFDGQNWQKFTTQNSNIPSNFVWRIAPQSDTAIWLAMGRSGTNYVWPYNEPEKMIGLAKFNGTSFTHYSKANSQIPSDYISAIAIDKKGNKWLSTAPVAAASTTPGTGKGLIKFDGTAWTLLDSTNSPMRNNSVTWVGVDRSNNIWITMGNSSAVFNEDGLPDLITTALNEAPRETIVRISEPQPNPAQSISFVKFSLRKDSPLEITLSNSLGERVATLLQAASHEPGEFTLPIDVAGLAGGVYFCTIRTETDIQTVRMIIAR